MANAMPSQIGAILEKPSAIRRQKEEIHLGDPSEIQAKVSRMHCFLVYRFPLYYNFRLSLSPSILLSRQMYVMYCPFPTLLPSGGHQKDWGLSWDYLLHL